MSRIVYCAVGSLVGDAWMRLPVVIDLCRRFEVKVVAGTYALPVWEWGRDNLVGADYEIIRVIEDPDKVEHPFCPGKGFYSMNAALEFVKAEMPEEESIVGAEVGSYYYKQREAGLVLKKGRVVDGECTVIHPYTSHGWKNCRGVVMDVEYERPTIRIGLPGEVNHCLDKGILDLTGEKFDAMAKVVLESAGFVGVLSSWFNFACLFRKKIIVASFTRDIPTDNPRVVKLVEPTKEALQDAVTEMGL